MPATKYRNAFALTGVTLSLVLSSVAAYAKPASPVERSRVTGTAAIIKNTQRPLKKAEKSRLATIVKNVSQGVSKVKPAFHNTAQLAMRYGVSPTIFGHPNRLEVLRPRRVLFPGVSVLWNIHDALDVSAENSRAYFDHHHLEGYVSIRFAGVKPDTSYFVECSVTGSNSVTLSLANANTASTIRLLGKDSPQTITYVLTVKSPKETLVLSVHDVFRDGSWSFPKWNVQACEVRSLDI